MLRARKSQIYYFYYYPEFAVEDLPLGRTSAFVPEFAVKDLSLGRILDDDNDEFMF